MQMYRVRFARKLLNDLVDLGDCVACSSTAEGAQEMVATIIGFPPSTAEFEVVRVKPSLYLIGRREVRRSMSSVDAHVVDASLACRATFPNTTETMADEYWYAVQASANIKAEDKQSAIAKLARGIVRALRGEKQKFNTRDLEIKSDRRISPAYTGG